jgi:hypothetical protein
MHQGMSQPPAPHLLGTRECSAVSKHIRLHNDVPNNCKHIICIIDILLFDSRLSMAQTERDLEERLLVLGFQLEFHSQQLDASVDILADVERRVDILKRNASFEIDRLRERVRELEIQVEKLSWWEPWLRKVYRWWYGSPPIV